MTPPAELRFEQRGASVPPPDHRDVTSTLGADGTGVRRTVRSYGRGETTEADLALAPEAFAALWTDLRALGLFATDWTEAARPPIGGGVWRLWAAHAGETAHVPGSVVPAQRAARRAVGERVRQALAEARP